MPGAGWRIDNRGVPRGESSVRMRVARRHMKTTNGSTFGGGKISVEIRIDRVLRELAFRNPCEMSNWEIEKGKVGKESCIPGNEAWSTWQGTRAPVWRPQEAKSRTCSTIDLTIRLTLFADG
jgi:hypothetical protein